MSLSKKMIKVVLASDSQRRRDLVPYLTGKYSFASPKVEEIINPNLSPAEAAMDLADKKARSVFHKRMLQEVIVIGCDTIIVLDGVIYGKPKNLNDARQMIRKLQGKTHKVITGVSFINQIYNETFYVESEVTIKRLTDYAVEEYLKAADYLEYAGGYALQDRDFNIVESYKGSASNIIGFPLEKIGERYLNRVDKKIRRLEIDRKYREIYGDDD